MQRTITSFLFAFLLAAGFLSAQSVESFNYNTGQTLEGLEGSGAWGGPWVLLKGNDQTSIDTGGVSVPALAVNSGSNHLVTTHNPGDGGARMYRLLDTPVTDDGSTYYLSWFMINDYDNPPVNGSVHQVMLTNSAGYGAAGPGGQLVRMGKLFNTERVGVDGISVATATAEGTDTREGLWLVAVVEMSGDDGADTVRVFVNPDPSEPLDFAAADIITPATLNNGFDAIGAKLEGPAGVTGRLDEIRFGTSYADVISGDLVAVAGPASDNFNLPAGAEMGGSDNGPGWFGPWNLVGGANPTVVEGGFENFDILRATTGNRVEFDFSAVGGNTRIERPLNGVFPDDGSTYYLSFSTQSNITNTGGTVAFVMLVDTAAYMAGGPGGQLVQIGKPLNTTEIGVGLGSQPADFALSGAFSNEPHLVVARIKMSGNADPDTVDIFVDPPLDMEPVDPDATRTFNNLNNGFNGIGIKVEGLGPGIITEYDDIYVGLDYASVIPADLIEIENPVDAFAYDKFSYTPGDELTSLGGVENGWAGPWEALADPDSSIILAGGLINNQLLAKTSGERVRLTSLNSTNRIQRLFETPIDTMMGEFWFSVHMAINGPINNNVGNIVFVDTTKTGPQFQQLIVGKQFNTTNIFAGGFGQVGGDQITGEQFDGSTARWLVGHLVRNSDNGTWEMDLWVDPDPAGAPMEADAQLQNKPYTTTTFHGVALKADGLPNAPLVNLEADDVFIGETFEQVVPDDLSAIPPLPDGAVDNFNDYAAGEGLETQTGGQGWDAGWELITGEDGDIVEGGLTNFFLLRQTSGNSVSFDANVRMVRDLAGSYGDVGRSFWLGWFFDTDNGGGNVAHLVLADKDTYQATGPGGQLAQIGKTFGGDALGIVGAPSATAPGVSVDTTHFIVLEVVTNGSPANDEIYLWVDPDLTTTPSRDTANAVGGADLTNWNAIGFKVEGNPGVTAKWDDVRLGNSFAEIVPPDLTEVLPPEIPIPAVETFDYAAGEDLNGQDGGEGWSGPWQQVEGTILIGEGAIDSDRVTSEGNLADVNQSSTPVVYDRPFFNRFGAEESTVWMSFLMDVELKNIGNTGQVSLVRDGNPVLSIGGIPGLENLSVVYNDGGDTETSTTQSVLGVSWVVVRMNLNGTDDPDEVRVWIDPPADALPTDGNALFTLTDVDLNDGFDALRINASGVGSLEMLMDEFRIGFSYRDISNKFGSDDPNLLAYEPFNYDVGQSLIDRGGINAFWDGVWFNAGNLAGNETEITEGSAVLPGFEEVGNKAEFRYLDDGTQIRIDRELAFPMESDGSVYWITWFQNTTTGDQLNNVSNVSLRNSGASANDGQRLNIGRMFGAGKFGMISPPANANQQTDVDDLGLNWVVVRIQTVDNPAIPDTAWMWINPAPEMEPDTADAEFFNPERNFYAMTFLKDGIDVIRLKVEGVNGNETPHIVDFDEFRIATTWESASSLINSIEVAPEDRFQLSAYPNPFADELNLKFQAPDSDRLLITVHDSQGRLLSTLADQQFPAGEHTLNWQVGAHTNGLTNGVYYLRIQQRDAVTVRKLILLRN